MSYKVGDSVNVAELDSDTGLTSVGTDVKELKNPGKVVAISDYPPHVQNPSEDESISPHTQVEFTTPDGETTTVWFNSARVEAA